jgi:hypothetical protein
MDGGVTFTYKTGKKSSTTGTYNKADNYLDARKKQGDYPTPLDFKNKLVASITFTPNPAGKATEWTSWKYFNNGEWEADRFTELG